MAPLPKDLLRTVSVRKNTIEPTNASTDNMLSSRKMNIDSIMLVSVYLFFCRRRFEN